MSRRILAAIVAVTAAAVAAFGVPLAVAVARLYRDEAVVRLERQAAQAGASVPASFATTGDPVELPPPTDDVRLGLYSPSGARLTGAGPERADPVVRTALGGRVAERVAGGDLVVASPVASEEAVVAVIRVELPKAALDGRIHRAWLLMVALGAVIVAVAALVGLAISRRLARPAAALASASARLGGGDFTARAGRSGIPELDAAAANLDATAERLGRLVQRERAFSADASHQLRTPLTGLRLHLERAAAGDGASDGPGPLADALADVDRLERTIDDLLNLARDVDGARKPVPLGGLLEDLAGRWHGPLAARACTLRLALDPAAPAPCAAPAAIRQIVDVLLANAAEHGAGTVTLATRAVPGGVAVEVADDGPGVTGDPAAIFRRRAPGSAGHGIGLALARSLAEAEGARLVLARAGPRPVFRLLLPTGASGEPPNP